MRGSGRSGKPADAAAYTSKRYAQDVEAVVAAFRLADPYIVAWGFGAAICADVAAVRSVHAAVDAHAHRAAVLAQPTPLPRVCLHRAGPISHPCGTPGAYADRNRAHAPAHGASLPAPSHHGWLTHLAVGRR
jgi:pimeloyl-ACP methyl ester carboxylesterase